MININKRFILSTLLTLIIAGSGCVMVEEEKENRVAVIETSNGQTNSLDAPMTAQAAAGA